MHSHCGCVKLTVVIICKQFITWEETWFKSCSTQKGRKIQMLPSSCFRWHSPLQNLCNTSLLWWATSKLHFKYKCITNVMCISDIDAYQYQYLKDKTHNNPPYQSIMSIQIRWYSPINWRLCNISQLDELHQSSTFTPIPVLINYQVSTVMSTNTSSFQDHIETKLRSERSWFRKVNPNPQTLLTINV